MSRIAFGRLQRLIWLYGLAEFKLGKACGRVRRERMDRLYHWRRVILAALIAEARSA